MNHMLRPGESIGIRKAQMYDIPVLSSHHRLMFEEMSQVEGVKFENADWAAMEESYKRKLEQQLTVGTCIAYVLEFKGKILASGAVTIVEIAPLPNDPNSKSGYIHSIYTDKEHRRKGYAKLIMEELIMTCKTLNIRRVQLKPSKAGIGLYEKLGFKANTSMTLWIEGEQ